MEIDPASKEGWVLQGRTWLSRASSAGRAREGGLGEVAESILPVRPAALSPRSRGDYRREAAIVGSTAATCFSASRRCLGDYRWEPAIGRRLFFRLSPRRELFRAGDQI